jgi:hypothetical protein
MASPVNNVATKSHELPILAPHIQRDRSDLESDANLRSLGVAIAVVCLRRRDSTQEANRNRCGCQGYKYLFDLHITSPKDGFRCNERTRQRTVKPDEHSGKLQSTARAGIRRPATQCR